MKIFKQYIALKKLDKIAIWIDKKEQGVGGGHVSITCLLDGRGGWIADTAHSHPNEKGESIKKEWQEWGEDFCEAIDRLYKETVLNQGR